MNTDMERLKNRIAMHIHSCKDSKKQERAT